MTRSRPPVAPGQTDNTPAAGSGANRHCPTGVASGAGARCCPSVRLPGMWPCRSRTLISDATEHLCAWIV